MYLNQCMRFGPEVKASSDGSYEPASSRSLARSFAAHRQIVFNSLSNTVFY